jgi:hypothetical protein
LPEINDIAFEIDWHLHETDEPDAELGRDQLQPPRQDRIDEIGQRDRKGEKHDGNERDLEQREPTKPQHDAEERNDESELREQKERAQFADRVHEHGDEHECKSGPGGPPEARDQRFTAHPEQPQRNGGDEEAVAVFVLRDPAPHQLRERAMERRYGDSHGGKRDNAGGYRWRAINTNGLGQHYAP